ncbi:MAG TPA: cytochrome d ubiquinol oxidase subunit II, partial [Micromonosporaceae bacterium]
IGMTLYAWSGIADFGAGFWDLIAGNKAHGLRARALIDEVITPVWEANHVWLIYILVVTWTAFGGAFGSIMTALFVPFALAALGIVLRGANFALRKDATRSGGRQWSGWLFGIGAVMTPFFFGTAIGAIMSGRVPPNAVGNPVNAWVNAVSITTGLLTVAVGAFTSACYLVVESARRGVPELRKYFRIRALIAGVVALLCGVAVAIALRVQERSMFNRITSRSIPLIVLGVVALLAAFVMARRGVARGLRVVAAVGVGALVWAWAVAQYPYLLPFRLTISDGAGSTTSMKWLLGWFIVALVTVIPMLIILYTLDQRGHLGEDPGTSRLEPAHAGEVAAGAAVAAESGRAERAADQRGADQRGADQRGGRAAQPQSDQATDRPNDQQTGPRHRAERPRRRRRDT